MSEVNFGALSQLYLMQLAGLVYSDGSRIENPSEAQIKESKRYGRAGLKRLTQEDYGYNVLDWFEYLVVDADDDCGITHAWGYRYMRKVLKELGVDLPYKKDLI